MTVSIERALGNSVFGITIPNTIFPPKAWHAFELEGTALTPGGRHQGCFYLSLLCEQFGVCPYAGQADASRLLMEFTQKQKHFSRL